MESAMHKNSLYENAKKNRNVIYTFFSYKSPISSIVSKILSFIWTDRRTDRQSSFYFVLEIFLSGVVVAYWNCYLSQGVKDSFPLIVKIKK